MKKTITYKEIKGKVLDIINNGGGGGGGASLKTFTFTGASEDAEELDVNLPSDCNLILAIKGNGTTGTKEYSVTSSNFLLKGAFTAFVTMYEDGNFSDGFEITALYDINNGKIHFEGIDDGMPFAFPITFTAYYM